jgi:hypothetical protein
MTSSLIIKSKLNDKYFLNYSFLFKYNYNKFNIINQNLLYNFIFKNPVNELKERNINFKYSFDEQIYANILLKTISTRTQFVNTQHFIINNYINNNKSLIITNIISIIVNTHLLNNNSIDTIFLFDINLAKNNPHINYPVVITSNYKNVKINGTLYSALNKDVFKQFLINLKNNNEYNNISIPKTKYDFISCHVGYIFILTLIASYKMTLTIPTIISSIAIALKNIAKNGTLLLFWSIVNVNIPVIKKILSLLAYGFKNVEIIDNDINQNLLIGVPEYYIKCSGYKDNISHELINKLIDIAIETIDNIYSVYDILDYYEDYTEKNPNHSLFYNKNEEKFKNYNIKKTKKTSQNSQTSSKTKTSNTRKSLTRKSNHKDKKSITPIYYIEDINIPELDKIMQDSHLQFKVANLSNKLETIFVGYFEMVNNLIVTAIAKDKKGNMYVKKEAMLQKDITNITKLINMFEYNKLPYNKHALKVLLNKKNEILSHFYSLDNPVNIKLIQYDDKISKYLNINALNNFVSYESLQKPYDLDILNDYYNRIKLPFQVKNKLLEDIPNQINVNKEKASYAGYDFSINLCNYLNDKNKKLPIKINNTFLKIWEILSQFNLIPNTIEKQSLKVLYLDEFSGQIITCINHWLETKCHKFNMENYEWMANTINPFNYKNINLNKDKWINYEFNNVFHKKLIKDNYKKWLWGEDNTGILTNVENIKSIVSDINTKWNIKSGLYLKPQTNSKSSSHKKTKKNINNNIYMQKSNDKSDATGDTSTENKSKLDLIISDGSLDFNPNINTLNNQKLELSKVISIIATSSVGSACCSKHFIPSKTTDGFEDNANDNTSESTNFFIGYLYLYYIMFDSVSLYKPNSSESDSREFYVIGKGFKGITEQELTNLYNILDYYVFNSSIIEKEKIPITFVYQINNFLEDMSAINILSVEKQNLLLTCFQQLYVKNSHNDNHSDKKQSSKANKILKCDNFFNKKKIDTISIPQYREWIKIFNFE